MKRKERARMRFLLEKYYDRMDKINKNYDLFIKDADNFRMKCVEEIGKLMNQDKELQALLKKEQVVWRKNHEHKRD